jgi:Tfp pilus assembly protein PilF
MTHTRLVVCSLILALAVPAARPAAPPPAKKTAAGTQEKPAYPRMGKGRRPLPKAVPGGMPLTGLVPARLVPNLCVVKYQVTTSSEQCQAFFDQALGYYYSYVWMEAARSFETALKHDPDCALAYWGLARALERWGRGDATKALLRAWDLRESASDRERYLIKASMQEKGQLPGVGDQEKRKQAAIATIDEMLALYDDDEEGWYFRAQLAGGSGLFGGQASSVPFYKALLRVNPLHPGANHELLHFYENFRRPALGWPHAESYIKSSPGIPHAFHMQAHLATRLGRWGKTSDRSARAIELQRAYHKYQEVKPQDDWQYSHHLETLLVSLTHDGRFAEARAIKKECEACNFTLWNPFFRLALAERDWDSAQKVIDHYRRRDKTQAAYFAALLHLKKGDPARALPELHALQEACRKRRNDRRLELKLWEAQGLYQCATREATAGLKQLAKAVNKTKDDYSHHAWGNGAYHMEAWGVAALACNKLDTAEEAFHEALAHDPGSVRAALGMQVLCERQGRAEEVERFAVLARRCWGRADRGKLEEELAALREGKGRPDPSRPASGAGS